MRRISDEGNKCLELGLRRIVLFDSDISLRVLAVKELLRRQSNVLLPDKDKFDDVTDPILLEKLRKYFQSLGGRE